MLELIKYILENIMEHPETVVITKVGDEYKIAVPRSEIGKVIGKQGKVAKAIRTIVKAVAGENSKANIDIVEA